jgi:hypothetical protein
MTCRWSAGLVALSILLLSGCGGGGGGGSSGPPEPSVSISGASLDASATYAESGPGRELLVTVTNPPSAGLHVRVQGTSRGIGNVDFRPASATTASLIVQFRSPLDLSVGTVTDQITVSVCKDSECAQHVRGSPMTVATSYTVSSPTTAALAVSSVSVKGAPQDSSAPQGSVAINLTNAGPIAPSVRAVGTFPSIDHITGRQSSPGTMTVQIDFRHPSSLGLGVYNENLFLRVCYDTDCRREVNGSPFIVQTSYTVGHFTPPEQGVPPLPYLTRTTLSHDVVDAEYSAALDAIVMVSAQPTHSLYVYDTATGAEREVRLNRVPTAVSVSLDGQTAAVGHDALITVVELADAGQPGAPSPTVLNVSADVFDLVLDGRGFVHAFPRTDQWVEAHSVEIATNIEQLGAGSLRAGSRAKLHPAGDFVYTADTDLYPSDITKFDIRSGAADRIYDSPYHGEYAMCGSLWLKQDGAVVYTKCGNTFRTSTTQSQDLLYNGRLQLSIAQVYDYQIDSLSQSDATDEIALLEAPWYACTIAKVGCYTHLNLYESAFLNRTAVYSLAPVEIGTSTYTQRGLFVFHSADGLHRYIISRLFDFPAVDPPYYVTVQQ